MSDFINVALPKGRLGESAYALLKEAGLACPQIEEANRRLIFENPESRVRYFWAKPADVAVFVEKGAADLGVVGKDILLEQEPDVYELLDLKMGICRLAVAGPASARPPLDRTLRVATKFPSVTRKYFEELSRAIEIIPLHGSIELAPLTGLSDVIVDIVETGATLKENNLIPYEDIAPVSARLIANKAGYKFKNARITGIVARVKEMIG